MSMRINTNIEAFNAQRNLSNTATAYAKSVEKLSSGLRINRAGDDAAGLSISEKLKAQVNGLAQAQRNAQDGISLIQTAEGALNETHSILQRMRELTVQAANDTLADSDRNAIKSEMGQLSSEIDRIAHSTQFNGKNLLDGSLTATKSATLSVAATGLGTVADTQADLTAAVTFANASAGDYKFTITNAGAGATETGTVAVASTTVGTITVGSTAFSITVGDTATSFAASVNAANLGVTATVNGSGQLVFTSNVTGSNSSVAAITGSASVLSDFGIGSSNWSATAAGSDAAGYYQVNGETATHALSFSVSGTTESLSGASVTIDASKFGSVSGTVSSNNSFTVNLHDQQANLQIGANAQQTLSVGIEDMGAKALGVDSLDVSNGTAINGNDGLADGKNADGTLGTLAKIDQAIATVSNQRSTLGAYQNRLEHTISNLGVAQENLTASESRIVDVDMAAEMVNFTKTGILQQAGQAILAQANQAPQGVLSLLRG